MEENLNLELDVTLWRHPKDPNGRHTKIAWSKLCDWFAKPIVNSNKLRVPGYSLAKFHSDYRSLLHFATASALVFDYDDIPRLGFTFLPFPDAQCLIHTTYSHTPEAPRVRLIVPLSRPVNAQEYRSLWDWGARRSHEWRFKPDTQAKDPSRLWFVPAIPASGAEYIMRTERGFVIDPDSILAKCVEVPELDPTPSLLAIGDVGLDKRIARARRYLDKTPGAISGQGGHVRTFLVAQKLANGFDLPDDEALDLMLEWNGRCQPRWSKRDLLHKLQQARRSGRSVERGQYIR